MFLSAIEELQSDPKIIRKNLHGSLHGDASIETCVKSTRS
jgi:hypothetical protein